MKETANSGVERKVYQKFLFSPYYIKFQISRWDLLMTIGGSGVDLF